MVRDLDHLHGIPNEDGTIPQSVKRADAIVDTGLDVIRSAHSNGKPWIIENPVSRAKGSPFHIVGRERHACLFDHPPVVRLAADLNSASVAFDQGALGADTQKTTQLLCSEDIHLAALKRFGPAHRSPVPLLTLNVQVTSPTRVRAGRGVPSPSGPVTSRRVAQRRVRRRGMRRGSRLDQTADMHTLKGRDLEKGDSDNLLPQFHSRTHSPRRPTHDDNNEYPTPLRSTAALTWKSEQTASAFDTSARSN